MTPTDPTADATEVADDDGPPQDPRLVAAMREYMAALDSGKRVNRRELVGRHPEIAAELSACLQGLSFVHMAAGELSDGGGLPPAPTGSAAGLGTPLGDFRLLREIGRGGMGVVYEATQLSLGRPVAVKVLPMAAALDPRRLQRFRNEAQAAAGLHHTNIVPVYAVGCERSTHFYAMQLIEGRSLAEVIRELRAAEAGGTGGRRRSVFGRRSLDRAEPTPAPADPATVADVTVALRATVDAGSAGPGAARPGSVASASGGSSTVSPSTAWSGPRPSDDLSTLHAGGRRGEYFRTVAKLGVEAAEALDYAHGLGILHRDVKPANLLLDGRGKLWVTDFGLAQMLGDNGLTQTGDLVGTYRYMSPEQAGGGPGRRRRDASDLSDGSAGDAPGPVVLDPRTDVYALGVTLYELLTLRPALPGPTREDLMWQLASADPKPPRQIDRTIPVELQTILAKSYAKDAADRYPTAKALADDLRRFLADEPIHARPPTVWDRAVKWTRRHKSLALSAIVVLTLAAAGLGASTLVVSAEQLRASRGEAEARTQTTAANAARAQAEAGYAQARETVNALAGMATDELPDGPTTAAVRRRMLETVAAYYKQYVAAQAHAHTAADGSDVALAQRRWKRALDELVATDARYRVEFDIHLLARESVEDDLRLTDTQADAAERLSRRIGHGHGDSKATDDDADADTAESVVRLRASLAAVVTPQQLARLGQVSRQSRGALAFDDPEVRQALDLTPEQAERIGKLRADSDGPGGPGARPRRRPRPPARGRRRRARRSQRRRTPRRRPRPRERGRRPGRGVAAHGRPAGPLGPTWSAGPSRATRPAATPAAARRSAGGEAACRCRRRRQLIRSASPLGRPGGVVRRQRPVQRPGVPRPAVAALDVHPVDHRLQRQRHVPLAVPARHRHRRQLIPQRHRVRLPPGRVAGPVDARVVRRRPAPALPPRPAPAAGPATTGSGRSRRCSPPPRCSPAACGGTPGCPDRHSCSWG